MATSPMNTVIRHLRKTVLVQDAVGMTDEQLLDSFIAGKDEAAFEALLRRYGPMRCRTVSSGGFSIRPLFLRKSLRVSSNY